MKNEQLILKESEQYDASNALALAIISQLAYPDGRDIHPDYKNKDQFISDMNRKKELAKDWGFHSFSYCYSEEKKILALILGDSSNVVVVFRGTVSNNFSNWITDIQVKSIPFGEFGNVHSGFRDALQSVWVEIRGNISYSEKRNIWLTGHSLGGALALLAGARFVEEYPHNMVKGVITFGQPRVGDETFKQSILNSYLNGRIYKYANYNDTITVSPPSLKKIMEYEDVGHICYFDKDGCLEFKDRLSEFKTAMDFLSGYFHQYLLSSTESKKGVKNWRSFYRILKRTFRKKYQSIPIGSGEEVDWQRLKQFFTKELPALPRRQRPQMAQQIVLDLFVQLFIKINPYGVFTHSISTYIDHLKQSMDTIDYSNSKED